MGKSSSIHWLFISKILSTTCIPLQETHPTHLGSIFPVIRYVLRSHLHSLHMNRRGRRDSRYGRRPQTIRRSPGSSNFRVRRSRRPRVRPKNWRWHSPSNAAFPRWNCLRGSHSPCSTGPHWLCKVRLQPCSDGFAYMRNGGDFL